MIKSSSIMTDEVKAVSSSNPIDIAAFLEEAAIMEELEETGIMGGFCEQEEDEL
jgi:hypothetical protein